jgi:hypothetical protein
LLQVFEQTSEEIMEEEVQKALETYSTDSEENTMAIGCDGRWMTRGYNSRCHAYNTVDLKTNKILASIIVERPVIKNNVVVNGGNYPANVNSKSMEGFALAKTLEKLPEELFERTSWLVVDGDLSTRKIITKHPTLKQMLNSGSLRLGLDFAHFRKKVSNDLAKLFGKGKKMDGFAKRIANWILLPIEQGKKDELPTNEVKRG